MATEENAVTKKEKISIPTKTTLNLCMKEKSVISPALFVPLLIIILVLAAVIGYFGVYKQFERVKIAQADLDETKAQLQAILDKIEDYDDVQKEYNRYNYEGFDSTISDPITVLGLLERQIFPVSTVRTLSIDNKTIRMTLTGLAMNDVATLVSKLEEEEIVDNVTFTTYTSQEEEIISIVNMTITLKDANLGGK